MGPMAIIFHPDVLILPPSPTPHPVAPRPPRPLPPGPTLWLGCTVPSPSHRCSYEHVSSLTASPGGLPTSPFLSVTRGSPHRLSHRPTSFRQSLPHPPSLLEFPQSLTRHVSHPISHTSFCTHAVTLPCLAHPLVGILSYVRSLPQSQPGRPPLLLCLPVTLPGAFLRPQWGAVAGAVLSQTLLSAQPCTTGDLKTKRAWWRSCPSLKAPLPAHLCATVAAQSRLKATSPGSPQSTNSPLLFALGRLMLSPGSFLYHLGLLPVVTPDCVILRPGLSQPKYLWHWGCFMAREERTSLHWGGEGSLWRGSQEPMPSSPHAGCPGAHSGAPWPLCPVSPSRYRGEWTQPKARPSTFPGRCPGHRPPPLRDACRPSGLGPDRGFLLRDISATTSWGQCRLPPPSALSAKSQRLPVSRLPLEQCVAVCGSTAPQCPADSGLPRWGATLPSHLHSQPQPRPQPFVGTSGAATSTLAS